MPFGAPFDRAFTAMASVPGSPLMCPEALPLPDAPSVFISRKGPVAVQSAEQGYVVLSPSCLFLFTWLEGSFTSHWVWITRKQSRGASSKDLALSAISIRMWLEWLCKNCMAGVPSRVKLRTTSMLFILMKRCVFFFVGREFCCFCGVFLQMMHFEQCGLPYFSCTGLCFLSCPLSAAPMEAN